MYIVVGDFKSVGVVPPSVSVSTTGATGRDTVVSNPVATKNISPAIKTSLAYHCQQVIATAVRGLVTPVKCHVTGHALGGVHITKAPYRNIIHVAVPA